MTPGDSEAKAEMIRELQLAVTDNGSNTYVLAHMLPIYIPVSYGTMLCAIDWKCGQEGRRLDPRNYNLDSVATWLVEYLRNVPMLEVVEQVKTLDARMQGDEASIEVQLGEFRKRWWQKLHDGFPELCANPFCNPNPAAAVLLETIKQSQKQGNQPPKPEQPKVQDESGFAWPASMFVPKPGKGDEKKD